MATLSPDPISKKPEILFLSLVFQSFLDETYSSLIDDLDKHTCLKRAKAAAGAIRYLEANNPKAILVTDEGLTKAKNRPVLDKVVSYLRNGGLVIIGLHFPNFITMDMFDNFFGEAFGLPWYVETIIGPTSDSILPAPFLQTLHRLPYLRHSA